MASFRIGEGWDTHQLVTGRKLILGGVEIPHSHGLLGHSDADALLHAITDALLGAAALGDIGRHFPDTDPRFAGADSAVLLAEAARRVRAAGWQIGQRRRHHRRAGAQDGAAHPGHGRAHRRLPRRGAGAGST
jgi:2-C-methyl-D-erythritol 2,4-cyclodiphosphate synthase